MNMTIPEFKKICEENGLVKIDRGFDRNEEESSVYGLKVNGLNKPIAVAYYEDYIEDDSTIFSVSIPYPYSLFVKPYNEDLRGNDLETERKLLREAIVEVKDRLKDIVQKLKTEKVTLDQLSCVRDLLPYDERDTFTIKLPQSFYEMFKNVL